MTNTMKCILMMIHLPKKAPYLNPNERRVNQQIKLDVCANRFYDHINDFIDAGIVEFDISTKKYKSVTAVERADKNYFIILRVFYYSGILLLFKEYQYLR